MQYIYTRVHSRPVDKRDTIKIKFLISQPKHVVGAEKNRLIESVLFTEHQNFMFRPMSKKIIEVYAMLQHVL